MHRVLIIAFLFLFVSGLSFGQGHIRFINNNLDAALAKAKQKEKLVFVDTYAPWCVPCKIMDKTLRDPQLSEYFNETFVNVRVNMDGKIGKQIHTQYEVVFLPTLLILNSEGHIRFKLDQLISAQDLLTIAQQIAEPELYAFDNRKNVSPNPAPPKPTQQAVAEDNADKKVEKVTSVPLKSDEKILYILDSDKSVPPEVLYEEAYFRMQLMDNSQQAAAKEYLDTQKDWTTPRNIRFIFDFLHATNTEEFEYFIATRSLFEKEIGEEQVAQTIQILVNERMARGYPRPDLEEAIYLLSLMGDADKKAYQYYLNRLYDESRISEFIDHAEQYLSDVNSKDHQVMFRLAECKLLTTSKPSQEDYRTCLDLVHKAILLHEGAWEYWDTQAYLFYKLGNKKKAAYSIKKAIRLANDSEQETNEMLILQDMISDL